MIEIGKNHNKINELQFIEFCIKQHDEVCNQKYARGLNYSQHLHWVSDQYKIFSYLVEDPELTIIQACYGHDLIEDARVSYNDIVEMVGEEIAEIIFLCTENKGRNRSERKNDVFYNQLKQNKKAVFVKLCDIIANTKYSLLENSTMFKKYKSEYYQKVKPMLYCEEYKTMFEYLDKLYGI